MPSSNFIDHVRLFCRSGNGGAGSVHFHRDKITAKGGPDGGNGGQGGSIILKGNRHLWTLLHLRYQKHVFAKNGGSGQGANKTGKDAEDIIVEVPLGTIAKDEETGEINAEIIEHDQTIVLLEGGRGGMGNANFATATRQAPKFAQPGEPGKEALKILELKVLADVGLVGFPNAGKSTLLSVVSAAKPEIADYPFTTLTPNLGIVSYRNNKSFVMADIPGIIEGASEGKGLGYRFLRHIERNALLLFIVAADSADILKEYQTLVNELAAYDDALLDKKRVLAISKSDLMDEELQKLTEEELTKKLKVTDLPIVFFSSITQVGIVLLKDTIWSTMNDDA